MHSPSTALEYGWNEREFRISFKTVSREPRSWKEELFASAHTIANEADKPIMLALSGGMDSEIMARSFFEQGINFSAFTFEHVGGGNRDDVERARAWCFQYGVPHRIIPFDVKRFLTTDIDAYMQAGYITGSPYRYLQLRLLEEAERMGGYGVLGNGKLNFHPGNGPDGPCVRLGTPFSAPFEWLKKNATVHQPFFLMSTAELVLSYIRIPFVAGAIQTPHAFENPVNNLSLRRFVYQTDWSDIVSRHQFRGFEKENELLRGAVHKLTSAFRDVNTVVDMPVHEMRAQLEKK